jgi:hypothetical protein
MANVCFYSAGHFTILSTLPLSINSLIDSAEVLRTVDTQSQASASPIPSPIVLDNKEGSRAGSEVSRSSGRTFALPTQGIPPRRARDLHS